MWVHFAYPVNNLHCPNCFRDRYLFLYMNKHLRYAGVERDIFSDLAIDEIFSYSSGASRLINKLATHCLLFAAQNGSRIIDDRMVKKVIEGELA